MGCMANTFFSLIELLFPAKPISYGQEKARGCTAYSHTIISCGDLAETEYTDSKEGGLTRELSSNLKLTFYPCTVFRQSRPLPEGALSYRCPTDDCIVNFRIWGVRGGNSIVYHFYFLATRLTAHANIYSSRILQYL